MISARHAPSAPTAVLIRIAAVMAGLATVVIIPVGFASAAVGRIGVSSAFETAAIAATLAIATALATRLVDPLRRSTSR